MTLSRSARFAVAFFLFAALPAGAETIKAVSWNLESGESKPAFLAKQMKDSFPSTDLWGLSEVTPTAEGTFKDAAEAARGGGQAFASFLGTTGGDDRLQIVYNSTRFELVESKELLNLRATTGRAPIFVKLKSKESSLVFIFMVNHLHRGSKAKRMEQTVGLRDWVAAQTVPVVMVGDFNYDVFTQGPKIGTGNEAWAKMMEGDLVKWAKHSPFVPTHKGHHKSVLDFIFLGGTAKTWGATTKVEALDDFSIDDEKSSDHRPVVAVLDTGGVGAVPPIVDKGAVPKVRADDALRDKQKKRDEILKKIAAIERELQKLRSAVREFADD